MIAPLSTIAPLIVVPATKMALGALIVPLLTMLPLKVATTSTAIPVPSVTDSVPALVMPPLKAEIIDRPMALDRPTIVPPLTMPPSKLPTSPAKAPKRPEIVPLLLMPPPKEAISSINIPLFPAEILPVLVIPPLKVSRRIVDELNVAAPRT